mgnify:CR=1 FL=1
MEVVELRSTAGSELWSVYPNWTVHATTTNVAIAIVAVPTADILSGFLVHPVSVPVPTLNDYYLVIIAAAVSYTQTSGSAIPVALTSSLNFIG